jgi:hypothetical protein
LGICETQRNSQTSVLTQDLLYTPNVSGSPAQWSVNPEGSAKGLERGTSVERLSRQTPQEL